MTKRRSIKFDTKNDAFYNLNSTVSSTECTGIAPAGLKNDAESQNTAELYSIHKGHK